MIKFLIALIFTMFNCYAESEVTLEWEDSPSASYTIEVSKSKDFKSIIVQNSVKQSPYKLNLPRPGTYYWRVLTEIDNAKPVLSNEVGTIIVKLPPLKTKHKVVKSTSPSEKETLLFSWKSDSSFNNFTLKVTKNIKGKKSILITKDFTSIYSYQTDLPFGNYEWMVEQKDKKGVVLKKSKFKKIVLKQKITKKQPPKKKKVAPPYTLTPKKIKVTALPGEGKSRVEFSWVEAPKKNSKFSFVLYKEEKRKGFYDESHKEVLSSPFLQLKLAPGKYMWEVSTVPSKKTPFRVVPPIEIEI